LESVAAIDAEIEEPSTYENAVKPGIAVVEYYT